MSQQALRAAAAQSAASPADREVGNPFGSAPVMSTHAMASTDQHRAVAEVSAAMAIARANPRNPIQAMDRILNACTRPTLAEQAVYQYSRGGTDITGPSIRLAEVLAQNWGNCQFGIRELEQAGGVSTVQAFCWDVETNVRREVTFYVTHKRHTKQGVKLLDDPRDIYEMVANQGARRLRACILAIIPGDVTEAAVKQCELTMAAKADVSPEGIRKMVEAFEAFAVTKAQIEARIQRRLDAIQPAQMVALKKVYASLRDGMSQPADWFDAAPIPPGAEEPAQAAQEPAGDEQAIEPEGQPALGSQDFLGRVAEAQSADDLDLIRSEASEALSGNALKAVEAAIKGRMQALQQ